MSNNGHAETSSPRAKILHISDLHFGASFDESSWKGLCDIAAAFQPNLVLITGDLVDNPHYWSLSKALDEISKLEKSLACKIIVVPGNHDTRLLGLLPIKWFNPVVLAVLLALSLTASLLSFSRPLFLSSTLWIILTGVLALAFLLRCVLVDFIKKFDKFLLPPPSFYSDFGLEIYAFDSASQGLFGARGKIPKKLFVDAQGNVIKQRIGEQAIAPLPEPEEVIPPYRIAILHHHPLPIPYDHAHEPLMVVDNAGSFLSEISKLRVRLVLHGHKHHRHFSRATINAGEINEHEVAVLSTGTPTRRGRGDRLEHHFNLLTLDGRGNMQVIPCLANVEGTFKEEEPFYVEPQEMVDKRFYEGAVEKHGFKSDSNVITVEITPDGDLHYRQEFHGFHIERKNYSLDAMPRAMQIGVGTGHIDDFSAHSLDPSPGEQIKMNDEVVELVRRRGKLSFGRKISSDDEPLGFYLRYRALNAFAMSIQQHRQMYNGGHNQGPPFNEHILFTLHRVPTAALEVILRFPAGFKVAGEPRLFIEVEGRRNPVLEQKFKDCLKYYPHLNVIVARIAHPPILPAYIFQWTLTGETPPAGAHSRSLAGKVEEIAQELLKPPSELAEDLQIFLEVIEDIARRNFDLESDDPIEISLMAYDAPEYVLRIVAANFPLSPEMLEFRLKYGDGIAGRAYKMNKGRMFVKRLAIENQTPSYYYPIDGQPYDLKNIDEEVIISLPLRHPDNEQRVFAVLSLSSKKASSRLQDIKEPHIVEGTSAFREAVSLACYTIFSDLL